jgi:hypothetical protein
LAASASAGDYQQRSSLGLGLVRDCLRVDLRAGAEIEADRLEDDKRGTGRVDVGCG